MASKPEYGIDAPGVIRNLAVIGIVLIAFIWLTPPVLRAGPVTFMLHAMFAWIGGALLVEGALMLAYAKWGKFRHRDRILALHAWSGDERVLDVGTGRGLLLAGAARRLTTGRAVGIDIWNTQDLSGNSLERTQRNLAIEGVTEKCELRTEKAQRMSFPNTSFDVILSNLCLHNIYNRQQRLEACREIARVLKPGGTAILSDYKKTREYAGELRTAGLEVRRMTPNWLTTFPPLTIVIAHKPTGAAGRDSA